MLIHMILFSFFLIKQPSHCSFFFFFNDTATTEIYTLSLHDALPISVVKVLHADALVFSMLAIVVDVKKHRSEEHTSELQSHLNLVCRLLLEKKKKIIAGCLPSGRSVRHSNLRPRHIIARRTRPTHDC